MSDSHDDLPSQLRIRTSNPSIISLPLDHTQTHQLLKNKLVPLLPYPITLVRRIQFELRHPSLSSQIYLALTTPSPPTNSTEATNIITTWLSQHSPNPPPPTTPFLAAYIDLLPAGQTQVVLFASWEIPTPHSPPWPNHPSNPPAPSKPITAPPDPFHSDATHEALVSTLLSHIKMHLIPLRPTSPPHEWLWLRDNKKYLSQPYSTSKVLFGAVHSLLIPYFSTDGTTRRDGRYVKFILPPSYAAGPAWPQDKDDPDHNLPPGYRFGNLDEGELKVVLERSAIPRTLETLRSLVNLGVYYTGREDGPRNETEKERERECIAWCFLSKDASLSSLHVEPAHRNLGLATTIGEELLRRMPAAFSQTGEEVQSAGAPWKSWDGDTQQNGGPPWEYSNGEFGVETPQWYGHVDVEENNEASQKVMRKLGGEVWFGVQWVEIDVGVVLEGLLRREDSGKGPE